MQDISVPREGIDCTNEWKLICELQQYGHLLGRPGQLSQGSTRTQELRNAINGLDLQIRRTFTTLQLDLILYLESEVDDDVSESSSDSETDEGLDQNKADVYWDDASSVSSLTSQSTTQSDDSWDSSAQSLQPSTEDAFSHLTNLCELLEARVNPLLIPAVPGDSDEFQRYPRLTRLVKHLNTILEPGCAIEFIPCPRPTPTQFLFNIADDEPNAEAFISFSDPREERPHKRARRQMLEKVELLRSYFSSFNNFVDKLKISLDNLGTWSNMNIPHNESFALLQKFRRQTATACEAIQFQFRHCTHGRSMKHKVLLQLPGWDDISNKGFPGVTESPTMQLFFTLCPGNVWQPARMYSLNERPDHVYDCVPRSLCYSLSKAYNDDNDLEFYVSDDCTSHEHPSTTVHIPKRSKRTRLYGDNCPDDKKSLWDLVKEDYFKKSETPNFLYNTNEKGVLVRLDQRKGLAAKLVIGLMLSIDSEHVLESWNPRRIYFLKPAGTHYSPFVPIPLETNNRRLKRYPKLLSANPLLEDGHALQPLPQFVLLAKALIHIAHGDTLNSVKFPRASREAFQDSWKRFRRLVQHYTQKVTCESEVDLEALPFLKAAEGCLNFHMEYQDKIIGTNPSQRMSMAWEVVFETILSEIDVDLKSLLVVPSSGPSANEIPVKQQPGTREAPTTTPHSADSSKETSSTSNIVDSSSRQELPTRGIDVKTTHVNPRQYTVPFAQLFDAGQTENSSTYRAKDFWERLDRFHRSCSQSAIARTIPQSGAESPRRIRIAVLDTGFDFNCSYIHGFKASERVRKEWCHSWVGDDVNDDDEELHGTNCAYLLHKAAPEADIYVGKVFSKNSVKFYEAENIAKAIKYAADIWDVDIISMSFGLRLPQTQGSRSEDDSMRHDYDKIIDDIKTAIRDASIKSPGLMFAAASNNGKNDPRAFPARHSPHVFCVHASDGYGEDGGINPKTEGGLNFMTLGMDVELIGKEKFSKGGRVITKYKPVVRSGTSFATPIAAGIAATVLDLGARVRYFDDKMGKKMRRPEEMEKLLRLMSEAKNKFDGGLHYMAPWRFWNNGWEAVNEGRARWDTIEEELRVW